ncbi:MAG: penicillin-binding protein activator [Gammaproteobacteria bacterium]|nr:penicillin-binding protein activator [Gammaproteobacteria bacterium]
MLSLAGCAPPPSQPSVPDQQRISLEAPARSLLAENRKADAARAYLRAAEQAPMPLAAEFRVLAAEHFLDAGESGSALRALEPDAGKTLPVSLVNRHYMVRAGVALDRGDPVASLRALDAVAGGDLSGSDAARFYAIRAGALELNNDPMGALHALTRRSTLLPPASPELRANDESIWRLLGRTPESVLRAQPVRPPETLSGWLELRRLASSNSASPEQFQLALDAWRRAYPGHPANASVLASIEDTIRNQSAVATRVALFVPLSGDFAPAGQAIRDGFEAAWETDAGNPQRPTFVPLNSDVGDIASAYATAVAQGADFVVGPVRKELVGALYRSGVISVPTLLLNELEDGGDLAANIEQLAPTFEFSLSAEGEAREVARKAFADGHVRAATLVPVGEWGDRVEAAFIDQWQALGGVAVTSVRIPEEAEALSDVIKDLLGLSQSEARTRRLRDALSRRLAHQASARADIDFLFLAAFPDVARQVKPLLLFHRAADLPVYATSHAYSGRPDPERDQDIEGVIFGDMPWTLDPARTAVGQSLRERWPNAPSSLLRLYAFGADAYALVGQVRRLRANPEDVYPGISGHLSVQADGRVRRGLSFATIEQGMAQPLDQREVEPPLPPTRRF